MIKAKPKKQKVSEIATIFAAIESVTGFTSVYIRSWQHMGHPLKIRTFEHESEALEYIRTFKIHKLQGEE